MATLYPEGSLRYEALGDTDAKTSFTSAATAWDNVLTGKAKDKFHGRFISDTLRARLKERAEGNSGPKFFKQR